MNCSFCNDPISSDVFSDIKCQILEVKAADGASTCVIANQGYPNYYSDIKLCWVCANYCDSALSVLRGNVEAELNRIIANCKSR